MEIVTLFGIIITFITTVVGWVFTYRTQSRILKAQSDYQYHKEQQKFIVDDNLAFIKDLQGWFEKGRKIYLDSTSVSPLEIQKINANDVGEEERIAIIRQVASRFEDVKKIVSELKELRTTEPRLFYLAKIYDPLADQLSLWRWDDSELPHDLPQIIENFENEVMDQVYAMLYGETGRAFPKVEDQFYDLHESGIQAIERIKNYVVFQSITKGVKK